MSPIEWAVVAVVVAFLIYVLDWWVLIAIGLMILLWTVTSWPLTG